MRRFLFFSVFDLKLMKFVIGGGFQRVSPFPEGLRINSVLDPGSRAGMVMYFWCWLGDVGFFRYKVNVVSAGTVMNFGVLLKGMLIEVSLW